MASVTHEKRESTFTTETLTVTIGSVHVEFRVVSHDGGEPRLTIDMPANVTRAVLDEAMSYAGRIREAFRVSEGRPFIVSLKP